MIRNQSSSFGRSPNRNWIIRIFFLILGFLTNLFEKSFTLSRNHNLRMRNKIKCFVKDFRIKVLQDTDFCFFTYWCTPFSYFIPFADKISKAAWRKKKEKKSYERSNWWLISLFAFKHFLSIEASNLIKSFIYKLIAVMVNDLYTCVRDTRVFLIFKKCIKYKIYCYSLLYFFKQVMTVQ